MSYADLAVPSRALHLWRYTPWARIHPSTVDDVPHADPVRWEVGEGGVLAEGTSREENNPDIARAFLAESNPSVWTLRCSPDATTVHVRAVASGHVTVGHLHIVADGDATVVVHLSGEADWAGLHITAKVSDNVRFAYGLVNELSVNSKLLRCEDWTVGRDADVQHASLSMGGFRCKNDLRTRFTAPGSQLTQAVSVHGRGERHVDHHLEIHHDVGRTDSSLTVHSACDDRSHAIATGLLTIAEQANHCDAGQVFKNLLLSEKARAEAIPELEVLADEVAAAHGAASAPLDPDQMHYLMSRGLDAQESAALIVEGFMHDGFSSLTNSDLMETLRTRLTVHLECELKR